MTSEEIRLDFGRPERIAIAEAVLCAGKSSTQLEVILEKTLAANQDCFLTRLDRHVLEAIPEMHRSKIDYDDVSRTGFYNWQPTVRETAPMVAVVTAGSSDMPVAAEALRTLQFAGIDAASIVDVGVAGLWRLMGELEALRNYSVVIVVAGMDGALPSVLGGLVPGLIVAVPTSTGYGMSRGGETALNAALASCAPGISVVNIDNGYGAACVAQRAVNMISAGSSRDRS